MGSKDRLISISILSVFIAANLAAITNAHARGPKPAVQGSSLVAPLFINGQESETAWIFPKEPASQSQVEAKTLLDSLEGIVRAENLTSIRKKIQPSGTLLFADLNSEGLAIDFDSVNLVIRVEVPAALRTQTDVDLGGLQRLPTDALESAPFSGYLNLKANQIWSLPTADNPTDRRPLTGDSRLVVNVQKTVFDSEAVYQEDADSKFRRTRSRLARDDVDHMIRYEAGDIDSRISGYQSSTTLGGIGVSRVFALQPYRVTRPITRGEFFLKRPSTVEILVNGVPTQRLSLPAGPVNLENLAIFSGRNDIEFRITDDMGQVETVRLSVLQDAQLLEPGLQEFSYQFGFPSTPQNAGLSYATGQSTLSFFHRVGLNRFWTTGVNFQANHDRTLSGLENVWLSRLGVISSDASISTSSGSSPDWASRVRYRSFSQDRPFGQSLQFRLGAEYVGPVFAPLAASSTVVNVYSWRGDSYVTWTLPRQFTLGGGYSYQLSRTSDPNRGAYVADLTKSFAEGWQIALNGTRTQDSVSETRFLFSVTWIDPGGPSRVYATHATPGNTGSSQSRVDYRYESATPIDHVNFGAGAQTSADNDAMNADANYTGYRSAWRLTYDANRSRQFVAQSFSHQASLSAGTAIVWTGDAISWSRPINDSFAIFPAENRPSGIEIPINRIADVAEAKTDRWGPGVLADMNPYLYRPVTVDTGSLPPGYDAGKPFRNLHSGTRTGITVPIRIRVAAIAKARLLGPDAQPILLVSGEFRNKKNGESIPFFTNRKGVLIAEGLTPGEYDTVFFDARYSASSITVPVGSVGFIDLGDLKVEVKDGSIQSK